ncbi:MULTISPECIES: hypothetical protein [unclassified Streptosporangium]|uniref:hypothetical protein n=1 Tax=unclassified Streptosporangium TaxID=2632669 RepID=UPI002E2C8262|nr:MULTISPECIES: hypothetical protein [unclassified Streptosporangium]
MTLSPQAVQAMQAIGIPASIFPDTAGMDEQADLLRTVAADTGKAAEDAETTMRQTQQVYRGESGTALAGHWQQTGNSGGHLAQANAVAGAMPTALNGLSGIVKSAEALAGATAVYFTYRALMEFTRPDPSAPVRATAQLLYGRQRTGKILDEVREGTGSVLTRAIKQKIIAPLENMLRNMRRPGGPTPSYAGAGGRVPVRRGPSMEGPAPRGGIKAEMSWLGRRGSSPANPPSPKVQKAAEGNVEHQVDVNTARTQELKIQDGFLDDAIRAAEKRGDTRNADALKEARKDVAGELSIRKHGRHN